ncbi:MAG: alpha-galactosidase [Lachnospiraceae bacterium]|nr:alpha-galactosidase [Lachnospiraceae bacterium]
MSMIYDERNRLWKLDTPNTSYVLGLVDGRFLAHIYYGAKVTDTDITYILRLNEGWKVPSKQPEEYVSFMSALPMEFPVSGRGDYRESCINIKTEDGQEGLELIYDSYQIYDGKNDLKGLPSSFGDNVQTLEITLKDTIVGVEAVLSYSVFEGSDVIARSVKVKNAGDRIIHLTKLLSSCIELENEGFEVLGFYGSWAREHIMERTRLGHGATVFESIRGEEGHDGQPFIAVMDEKTDEDSGRVYAMQLVYSGSFLAKAKTDARDYARIVIGIQPSGFDWKLEAGEEFQAPEAVLTYSDKGLNKMTHSLHDFCRDHIIRSKHQYDKRPILVNSWEAAYFDFDEKKILSLAKSASDLGIDMLVLDDGWFGKHREEPKASLGDWYCNENKLKGGLEFIGSELKKMGLKFGLWFEPEMISEDSDLYRAHPEWVLHTKGREPARCRDQWVLDLSNPAVIEYLYESMAKIIDAADLAYIKWDMNRPLSDIGSDYLDKDRQGEIMHRHVIGVYELQERLISKFPELLIENCSSGGARFDLGMLYYSPQIWCSDDMDPVERLAIHEGTALLYPLSTIGSHVCKGKNDITGRKVPFKTRGISAMTGTFGYELDLTQISEEDRKAIPSQLKEYRAIQHLVQTGDYYRIASYRTNGRYDAFMNVSKDKKEAYLMYMQVLARPNDKGQRICLKGLDPDMRYEVECEDRKETYKGDVLMNVGFILPCIREDFSAVMIKISAK